jgi:hypothetical protein
MKFFAIASAAFAAFSGLVAAQSPTVVVKDIQTLTQMSSDANTMISSLDIVTVVTQGYVRDLRYAVHPSSAADLRGAASTADDKENRRPGRQLHAGLPGMRIASRPLVIGADSAQGAPGRGPIPFGDADAQTVVAVLSTFVSVHQQLLATVRVLCHVPRGVC